MNAAADLNHVTVKLPSGETRELGTFWKERPVVLSFVRQLGCIFCRKEVTQLRKRLPEIRGKGAELVVVGTGTPAQAARFAKEYGGDFPVVADPGRRSYQAVGFKRGVFATFSPVAVPDLLGAVASGLRQGRTQGDPIQLGGMFVITPDQRVLFEHMARNSADLADIDKALASLDNGAAAKLSNTPGRRVALVTGGSAGIGKAIALLLVEKNHDIALVARRAEPLDACAEKIRAKGARALTLPLDVADDAAFSAALDRTESEWGPIDLFVASAGIGYATPATDFDLGAAQAIVDLNVSAFTRNVAAVLARMVERNHGHIVALSSLAGYRGLPGNAAYCASKAYVSAFMESVRLDLRRTKVKTTTVHPGWVQTEMIARNEKKKPMVMRPERVAELVWDAVRGGKSSVSMPFPLNAWTRMGRHSPNLLFDVSMRGKRWPFDA